MNHIKNKLSIILLFLILNVDISQSQSIIDKKVNLIRDNDKLVRIDISKMGFEINAQDCDTSQIWDLSNLKEGKLGKVCTYHNYNDSLFTKKEDRSITRYSLINDSLFCSELESPTLKLEYTKKRLEMVYPFSFGDSIEDYFITYGIYCKQIPIYQEGLIRIKSDGFGKIILPTKDTLENVVKISKNIFIRQSHLDYDSLNKLDKRYTVDSLRLQIHSDSTGFAKISIYQLYAKGYRYPIVENIVTKDHRGEIDHKKYACYYISPESQIYELDYDYMNDSIRNENKYNYHFSKLSSFTKSGTEDKSKNNANINMLQDTNTATYSYTCNKSSNKLIFKYESAEDTHTELFIFDLIGRKRLTSGVIKRNKGINTIELDISSLPLGDYILNIVINGENNAEKIKLIL